ncbi:MAG: DUF2231 domain-containing protein [Candidatus Omnitrophica bacterium]|nr:DUF2231 domain-containing protein [Candidatus Omnitrophota bacterium]
MESIHPMVVHFPIALVLTAVGLDLAAVILRRPTLHRLALWNLGLGTLGAAAAVLTGLQAEDVAKHSFEIWRIMELHKRLGITTLILGLMIVGWRVRARDQMRPRRRAVTLAVMLMMASTLGLGAYLGGRMVYEFGVGARGGATTNSPVPHTE